MLKNINISPIIGYIIINLLVVPYMSKKPFIILPKVNVITLALNKLIETLLGIILRTYRVKIEIRPNKGIKKAYCINME